MAEWQSIESAPEGKTVRTIISDGDGARNDQPLKRKGRLWFYPDGSMYVYYTPTHWKTIDPPERLREGGSSEPRKRD